MIATPEAAFADEAADGELVKTVKEGLEGTGVIIADDKRDINDDGFAIAVAEQLVGMLKLTKKA